MRAIPFTRVLKNLVGLYVRVCVGYLLLQHGYGNKRLKNPFIWKAENTHIYLQVCTHTLPAEQLFSTHCS